MSDFIMIAPAGWVDMEYASIGMYGGITDGLIQSSITTGAISDIEAIFRDHGKMPEGTTRLKEMRFIDNSYLWAIFE